MKRTDISKRITQQQIKAIHLKQIFLLALKNNGISKAQIKRELHLSFPSAAALADELLANGVLEEKGTLEAEGRGRPSTILQINPGNYAVPVVKNVQNGFETYLFDTAGKLLEQKTLPVEYEKENRAGEMNVISADEYFEPVLYWIEQIKPRYHLLDMVISVCGGDSDGGISSSPLRIRVTDDVCSYLQKKTGIESVQGNNVTYYAYAEKQLRADRSDFAFVHIGTGVGAGAIRDGQIFGEGPVRNGEIGHISIDYHGRQCNCGNKGCLEQYISISVIENDAGLPFEEVCDAYQRKDERIVRLLEEKAEQLAVGISSMLSVQFFDHVIIGGRIQMLGVQFLDTLREKAKVVGIRSIMDLVTFEYAYIGENGDAYGAFWDYMDHCFEVDRIIH